MAGNIPPPGAASAVKRLSDIKSEQWLRDNLLPPINDRVPLAKAGGKELRKSGAIKVSLMVVVNRALP